MIRSSIILIASFICVSAMADNDRDKLISKWNKTCKEYEITINRKKLFKSIEPFISKGMSQKELTNILGKPNAVTKSQKSTIWTYALTELTFFQAEFNSNEVIQDTSMRAYNDPSKLNYKKARPYVDSYKDAHKDLACWQALLKCIDMRNYRLDIGRHIALYYLKSGMGKSEVTKALGSPDSTFVSDNIHLWSYSLKKGTYLQLAFDAKSLICLVQEVSYDTQTGVQSIAIVTKSSGAPILNPKELDIAAWRATLIDGESSGEDRRGIGKRMIKYLKPGMSAKEVVALLGEPEENHDNEVYYYNLRTDASLGIEFDKNNNITKITPLGL